MKSLILVFSFFCLAFSLFTCTDSSLSDPPKELTLNEKFQKALDDGIKEYPAKGISAAVIMPDGEVWSGASGISSEDDPITTDMLFSAGSITKMFTACTIMQLVDEGVLSLEDSLHKWLPTYQNIDSNITIKQLLNHTNGIFDAVDHPELIGTLIGDPDKVWTIDEVLRNFIMEPYFVNEDRWRYSNTGYLLLRMIMKKVAGSSISAQYKDRFFAPLEMSNSFVAPEETLQGDVAQGWLDLDQNGTYDKLPFLRSFYSMAGGGVFCTAADLAKWTHSLLHEKNVLSQNMFEKMTTFYSPCPFEPLVDGYGLGLVKYSSTIADNLTAWGHGGNALGYAAASVYLPDYGVSIAFMDNTEEGEAMYVLNDIISIVAENFE